MKNNALQRTTSGVMITPNEPQQSTSKALGIPELYFKREDLHPFESHKGRSIPKMIELYQKDGFKHFGISSSGNAAKAASLFIKEYNKKNDDKLKLDIFVGNKINQDKLHDLQKLIDTNITIEKTERPLQKLFQILRTSKIKSLRQSTDDLALLGYEELARELSIISNLKAVFIPTSSGTTAEALGKIFLKLDLKIQIHVVQTTFCHPISEVFDQETDKTSSIADAIVDMSAHRKARVIDIIKKTNGSGWIVSDAEIRDAQSLVKNTSGLSISPNSALGIAGLIKAIKKGHSWDGAVACIITGK